MNRTRQSRSPTPSGGVKARGMTPSPGPGHREPRGHWTTRIQETVASAGPEDSLDSVIEVKGGAEFGQFCWIGPVAHDGIQYHSGHLSENDVLIEVQGQKLGGYTLRDAIAWIKQVSRNGAPIMLKTVKPGKS